MSDDQGTTDLRIRLRDLGQYLVEIADMAGAPEDAIASLAVPLPPAEPARHGVDDIEKLRRIAYQEYTERMRRTEYFSSDLFGEPAWDILLDLFVARISGLRISVKSSCVASQVPSTTALRWLGLLEGRDLIVRLEDPDDKRRNWIELTDQAAQLMTAYLRDKGKRRAKLLSDFSFATPRSRRP